MSTPLKTLFNDISELHFPDLIFKLDRICSILSFLKILSSAVLFLLALDSLLLAIFISLSIAH